MRLSPIFKKETSLINNLKTLFFTEKIYFFAALKK